MFLPTLPALNIISILLVDDHSLVRAGIARMLADEADMQVIAELSTGEQAIDFVRSAECIPDLVLMNARMPGMGGVEATRALLEAYPKIKVVAMSSVVSGIIPSQMLRAGAQAFISKNIEIVDMLKAIRMVCAGQHYVSQDAATHLALDPFNKEEQALFDKLSRREMQIAQLLTDGKKVSQISHYLELSPKTVYSYRYRIFEKLGISSDLELTILAIKHGLTEDSQGLKHLPQINAAG
ncbi:MAG: response regulator [Pseudomonadales bacterium]|nr:response regulator [Pseudomonadales bacterium]